MSEAPPLVSDPASAPTPAQVVTELGVLRVEGEVDGAQAFPDRRFAGATPVRIEAVAHRQHFGPLAEPLTAQVFLYPDSPIVTS